MAVPESRIGIFVSNRVAVPEPSSLVFSALGGTLLLAGCRRVRRQQVGTWLIRHSIAHATLVANGGAILPV